MIMWHISPRSANYLRNGVFHGASGANSSPVLGPLGFVTADAPNATITSISIQAKVGDAGNTVYIKDVYVFERTAT